MDQVNKLRNKKVYAAVAVFVLLALAGGVFLFMRHQSTPVDDGSMLSTQNLPTLSPEAIGMVVTVRPDKKAVKFELTKAGDIKHVSYEIHYNKKLDGQKIPEGFLGEMNIAEDGITKTDYWPFGSCSSGTCHYDEGVSDVTIKLVVTKKDGKTYQVIKIVKL